MNEDVRYGLCFKKRSSFETQFRLCSLKAKGRDKWLIIKTM